jgi:hypothetical protein
LIRYPPVSGHPLSPEAQKKLSVAARMGVPVRAASTIEDLPDKVMSGRKKISSSSKSEA